MAAPARKSAERSVRVFRVIFAAGVWLLAFACFGGRAQGQQYPFVLIPNSPKGCFSWVQDSHGALWLAGCESGREGFYYFDGNRFIAPMGDRFPVMPVAGMAEDSDGGILISSSQGIYRFYRGRLDLIFKGLATGGIVRVGSDAFVLPVIKKGGDRSRPSDLLRISRNGGRWKADVVLSEIGRVQVRPDHDNHVLFGCEGGYCELSDNDIIGWPAREVKVVRHSVRNASAYAQDSAVTRDRFGCLWMRNSTTAAYQCPHEERATTLPPNTASTGGPGILELADGRVVLADFGRVAIGRPGKFNVVASQNGYSSSGRLGSSRDGNLWFTNRSGLWLMPSSSGMESWSERDGLELNTWSVTKVNNRMFAVAGDSVRVLEKDRSRWSLFARVPQPAYLLPGPNGTILVASRTAGIWQLGLSGRALRKSVPIKALKLARTPDGEYWMSGDRVARFSLAGDRIVLEPVPMGVSNVRSPPVDLKVDGDGSLWECDNGGLRHGKGKSWRTFTKVDGLEDGGCQSLAIDGNSSIWYANANLGLTRIDHPREARPIFHHFQAEGETGRYPSHFIERDRRGWLWRGSEEGIHVSDTSAANEGRWLLLDRNDGIPALDTNRNAFFEDTDGSVWWGADGSVMHFSPPRDLLHPSNSPSAFISAFSWDGRAPQIADMVDQIKHGANLTAHIGSLQFDRRNGMHLRYRLLPQQSAWQAASGFDIPLGKLGWGRHTLEVQAQLMDGPWSETASKSFRVLLPIWLSWPALLVYAAAGSASGAGGYGWHRKMKARAAKRLPALDEFRLAALSPELGQVHGSVLDGRFEVGRVLARGGFATVAEGWDRQQGGQSCAIKIFRQDLVDDDWLLRRFQQEVLALEKIRHPNVVKIYGHGTTPSGAPYLAMEFIDGQTLREVLESRRLARWETASYLLQAGGALAEIHAHGICHRDLKPENFMIRRGAAAEQDLVLIDFSIAIVKDPDKTMHGLSRAAGTIYYMAPEQSIGYAEASSDIYSLAKIVIEMLTGERLTTLLPDASMDLPERVRELLGGLRLGLTRGSIELMSLALEFDPGRRPKNAAEFARQIAGDLRSARERTA